MDYQEIRKIMKLENPEIKDRKFGVVFIFLQFFHGNWSENGECSDFSKG